MRGPRRDSGPKTICDIGHAAAGTSEPFTSGRPISIDAHVAFGRPVLAHRGITTSAIVERIDAGESVADLAEDYDLSSNQIEEAVLYERAA